MVYRTDVTVNIIRPKIKKYKVIRLARVGSQKEQKHFICSWIFILAAFNKFAKIQTQQVFSAWYYVFCITV